MSFGRCAYRHAIRPTTTTTATADHVWINDELLASTFRRFTSGQRRHESRVPGPLEARRRLAKRRNTALASVAGPGILDDVACLFGRNGREHMKWTNGQGRPSVNQFSSPNAPAPLEDFYNETVGPFESGNPFFISPNVWNTNEEVPENRSIEEQLQDCRTVNELKYVVRVLNLDLRREPEYSRLIFDHLMSLFVSHQTSVHELLLFLDDRNLNIPGAGNYLGVVEHYVSRGVQWKEHDPLFDAVIRAFELGLIPAAEIRDIVERLSDINAFRRKTGSFLTKLYRSIWDAIGRCGIYGHRDLDAAIFDSWLGAILQSGTQSDYRLARTILLDAGHGVPDPSLWLQKFISRWLEDSHGLTVHPHNDGDYVAKFLAPFGADLVSQSLISVTKGLVTSGEAQLLKRWAEWLPKVQNVSDIVSSPVWADVGVLHSSTSHQAPMSPRHQILQRLWLLHTIWMGGGVRRAGRHPTIHSLHRLYDMARREGNEDLWNNFIKGIHDLKLPWKDLKSAVYYMRRQVVLETPRSGTSGTALQRFESKPLSFPDIFADPRASQAASHVFFHNMEKMIRRIDITSPAFLENALLIARTGDTSKLWTIVRILRSHTPLKIAISQSWHRPDPADMTLVRHPARPRSPYHPEPHACLEMIHMLATAFATSEQIHPRRAFSLVYWLSGFCYQHGAPIRPKLARSLYHAGIVRFRREGLRISTEQYNWIWDVVERAESPELMRSMLEQQRF